MGHHNSLASLLHSSGRWHRELNKRKIHALPFNTVSLKVFTRENSICLEDVCYLFSARTIVVLFVESLDHVQNVTNPTYTWENLLLFVIPGIIYLYQPFWRNPSTRFVLTLIEMKNMLFQLIYIMGFSVLYLFVSVCLHSCKRHPCLSREQLLFGSSFKCNSYTFLQPYKFICTHQELNDRARLSLVFWSDTLVVCSVRLKLP